SGGTIVNNGTIEAVADTTIGLQKLVIANTVSGVGELLIDAGATLVMSGGVDAGQRIVFAANTAQQFSNEPYTPSTLVLISASASQSAVISGVTYADRLVLSGVSASGATLIGGVLSVGGLTFNLSGTSGLVPVASVVSGANETIVTFVASGGADLP